MRLLVIGLVILLLILHQDFWLWDDTSVVLGFLPVGLAYHAAFCLATAGVGWLAVTYCWPQSVDDLPAEANPEEPS